MQCLEVFKQAFLGSLDWTWQSITFQVPWNLNYFWGLTVISLAVWALEFFFPWRKSQSIVRKDFWLDGFYMYFNFFIFSIAIAGFYRLLNVTAGNVGVNSDSLAILDISQYSGWVQLLVFFVVLDLVQWVTHILLHRFTVLWQFHKVHHSVQEMGFAAHLRYHWMENILYKPSKTIGVMAIGGFEPDQAYIVHFLAIAIGHINHANIKVTWGPFKYLVNNPVMHLWHHAMQLPEGRRTGVNFGISLSLWDYLFRTQYIPDQQGDIELGFEGIDEFPKGLLGQLTYGFGGERNE